MAAPLLVQLKPKPDRNQDWVGPDGRPTEAFNSFVQQMNILATMLNGNGGIVLTNAANDAAAAAANVPVGAFYRNGSVVMIRVV
jgi:hypothetical protein